MSKSDENTNELDSYGVWVKNTPGNDQSQLDEQADNLGIDTGDSGLDLPDFDDTDTEFSDMFRDEPQFSVDEQEDDFGNDLDSTLSTDELANITGLGDVAIENVDAEPIIDDFESSEPIFEETAVNEHETGATNLDGTESFEDFSSMVDELDNAETLSEPSESKESGDEEISIDDFMDEGFSDESVASGNNGYEPGAEKATETSGGDTEEIALDDFLDADSFDSITSNQKAETVEDEAPIEMDISFDDSVDTVETEDNASLDTDIVYDTDEDVTEFASDESDDSIIDNDETTEDVSEDKVEFTSTDDSNIDTEEIDLSDFGIDSDAEETPIVQDVENEKNKEKVVDYDLFVDNDTASSAPVVNEIKDEKVENVEKPIEEQKNTTTVDNSLLQQIVADLSSLKNEINSIKSNIAEITKATEAANNVNAVNSESINNADSEDNQDDTIADIDVSEESVTNEIPIPDVVTDDELMESSIEETRDSDETVAADETETLEMPSQDVTLEGDELADDSELATPDIDDLEDDDLFDSDDVLGNVEIPEDNGEGGFFSADDTDETIALSGDELSNIMNNADFGDSIEFESVDSENSELPVENPEPEDDSESKAEKALEKFDFDNSDVELTLDETPFEENLDDISDDMSSIEDNFYEDVPEEIAIPKDDDIFVASTSSDFMDSVKDTTEEEAPLSSEPLDEIEEVSEIDSLDDKEDETLEDISYSDNEELETDTDENLEIPTVDKIIGNNDNKEIETIGETFAETATEDNEEESFSDVDFLNNGELEDFDDEDDLSDGNEDNGEVSFDDVDFLNTSEETKVASEEESAETDEPEITFDDVDFLNASEPEIVDDITSEEKEEIAEPVTETDDETFVAPVENTPEDVVTEDEPLIEETSVAPEETVDEAVNEVYEDESFREVDNLDNNLSTSNIDYLTKEENDTAKDNSGINNELKQEIKSVLLYMDQLLESLPEDKIYEFAKSEEFTTYKKLFKDLGLS